MHPSTALATVLVDELVRNNVSDVVLSPGSRNAPLSVALHDADRARRLRLHVRIDERTAAFLALGLAKSGGQPAAVVTTSGTAAVNLHPAVVEAHHADVALVAITANRPPELQDVGANQTIDQHGLFGAAVRRAASLVSPDAAGAHNATWRATVCRLVAASRGELTGQPGPVHLDVALREPLLPDDPDPWPAELAGRESGQPWTTVLGHRPWAASLPDARTALGDDPRTLVLLGAASATTALAAHRLAQVRGWPLLAEPVVEHGWAPPAIDAAGLVLGSRRWVEAHLPDRVLVVGRPTLFRAATALLDEEDVEVVAIGEPGGWSDVASTASSVLTVERLHAAARLEDPFEPPWGDADFLAGWQRAGRLARDAVDAVLDKEDELTGPGVARTMLATLAELSLLVIGSSSAVRDVAAGAAPGPRIRLLANRGASGIDGTVSTAVGAALDHNRNVGAAYALMGDLTFLHDSNGLVLGPQEPRPDLTIVVNNDDGGGIFTVLEQGAPEHSAAFERVFGTPHGVDVASLCAATATPYSSVRTSDELRAALAPRPGIRVVEVRTDRSRRRDLDHRLRTAVADALADPPGC